MDSLTEDDTSSLLVTPAIGPATRRRNPCTSSIGSTSVGQSTTLPQTPPSTGRSAPPHAKRPKSQANEHSNLHVSQYKTKYLQSRTCGPRVKLPSLKSYKKHLPTPPPSSVSCTPSKRPLTFLSLPLEIRNMIYRELLVSATAIKKPHKLVWNKKSIMVNSLHPVKDIDSAILRVCRTIYDEALPVLYGKNTFEFCKPRKLRDFSHGILDGRTTSMNHPCKIPVSGYPSVITVPTTDSFLLQNLPFARQKLVASPLFAQSSCGLVMIASRMYGRTPPRRLRTGRRYGVTGTNTSSIAEIHESTAGPCTRVCRTISQPWISWLWISATGSWDRRMPSG